MTAHSPAARGTTCPGKRDVVPALRAAL